MPDFSAIRPYSNNSLKVDTYFDSYDDEPHLYFGKSLNPHQDSHTQFIFWSTKCSDHGQLHNTTQ